MQYLIICKELVSTSEDPIKGKLFQDQITMTNENLIRNQFWRGHMLLQQGFRIFQSIHARFQSLTSSNLASQSLITSKNSSIMKFIGIKGIRLMELGQGQDNYYQVWKTLFKNRDLSLRNFNDYWLCEGSFELKPKWSSYTKMMHESNIKQVSSTSASTGQPTRHEKAKHVADAKKCLLKFMVTTHEVHW